MMRRGALALAALLLVATTAEAGRVCVVQQFALSSGATDTYSVRQQTARITEVLDALGVDYDVVPQNVMRTLYGTTGTVNFEDGSSRFYSAFIHTGWNRAITVFTGWKPDSLWLGAKWSAVPQLFFAPPTTASLTYTQATTCTTGLASPASFFTSNTGMSGRLHLIGGPEVWCESGSGGNIFNVAFRRNAVSDPDAVNRVVIGHNVVLDQSLYATYTDADNFPNRPTQSTADSLVLFARYRRTAAGEGTGAPIIFCGGPNSSSGANLSFSLTAMSIAMLDSASVRAGNEAAVRYDGRIIGVKAYWKPKMIGVYIARAFARNHPRDTGNIHQSRGFYCYADSCDSNFIKASMDSLKALNVPLTVGVNVDSVDSYPAEIGWWRRAGSVRYAPEFWSGVTANALGSSTSEGAASSTTVWDAWGARRTRQIAPVGGRMPGTPCSAGDSTLTCLLSYGRSKLLVRGLTPLSRALLPQEGDLVPSNFSRSNLPTIDSLGLAVLAADYDHIITSAYRSQDVQFSIAAGGNSQPPITDPSNLGMFEKKYPIYATPFHALRVGTLSFVACRGFIDEPIGTAGALTPNPMWSINGSSHIINNEFMQGLFSNLWYGQDIPNYVHTFRSRLSVYVLRAGELGNGGPGYSTRPGYWNLKWLVTQARVINKLAGRTVIGFSYVDEL